MIIDLETTTTSEIAKRLVAVREEGGAVALGRVLTLLIDSGSMTDEDAIRAANAASAEHPMRVIVLERVPGDGDARLDAQIRVGGDAGASEVVSLRAAGAAADDPQTLVEGLLLPDAPVVTWWTRDQVERPSAEPLGRFAQLRITNATIGDGPSNLVRLAANFAPGDSDLAWTKLTAWRALLASVLDQPPYAPLVSATVIGAPRSATAALMGAWLALELRAPVTIEEDADTVIAGESGRAGLFAVRLVRADSEIELRRTSIDAVELDQTNEPMQHVALPLRGLPALLAEELRSLAPDRYLGRVLREGLPLVEGVEWETERA